FDHLQRRHATAHDAGLRAEVVLARDAHVVGRLRVGVHGTALDAIDEGVDLFLVEDFPTHTYCSLPALMTTVPASASRRVVARISRCASSTSERRTGPRASMSSLSISAARLDMFFRK